MKKIRIPLGLLALLSLTFAPVSAAAPGLNIVAPSDGVAIAGDSVTVTFTTSDFKLAHTNVPVSEAGKHPEVNRAGEGHLHFLLDLQPLVVWETDAPYTFANVPPGEHLLMVELVNHDHSAYTPQVTRQIRFSTTPMLPNTGSPARFDSGWILLLLGMAAIVWGALARRLRLT